MIKIKMHTQRFSNIIGAAHQPYAVILGLLSLLLLITACTPTGGGYNKRNWEYNPPVRSAEQPPATLRDNAPESIQASTIKPQAATAQSANLPPVKVGILLPLSGQHAKLGEAMLNAAQIALFDIGHSTFELIIEDTKGTPAGAREAAQSIIRGGAQLVLGPVFSDSVRAAQPIINSARVNMIAFSTDWTLAGDNSFIMGFLPFDQVDRIVKFAAAKEVRTVGVLAPNNEYGRVVNSAYQNAASRYGIQTVKSQVFQPQNLNLSPVVKQFAQYDQRTAQRAAAQNTPGVQITSNAQGRAPFDAVLIPVGGQAAVSISNLLNRYDLPARTVKRLGTGLLDDPALLNEPGLNGTWFAAPSPNLRRRFEQTYQTTYNERAPRLASLAYDATALAAVLAQRGLKTQGKPAFDRTSISNPNGFAGIDGIFRFRPNGTAERGLAVLEFRNGQIKIVEDAPKTFQQAPSF